MIKNKKQCKKSTKVKDMIQDLLDSKDETLEKNKEEEIKYYDKILDSADKIFVSENYDTSYLDEGNEEIIET